MKFLKPQTTIGGFFKEKKLPASVKLAVQMDGDERVYPTTCMQMEESLQTH